MNAFQIFIAFIGRVCISIIFLLSGINEMMNWQPTEQYLLSAYSHWMSYFQSNSMISSFMTDMLPWLPVLLLIAVAFKILCSLLIIIGWKVRFGAFLLILFLIPTTVLMHHFWTIVGAEREMELIMFLKNLSIFGGLLLLLAFGKGCKRKEGQAAQEG
jgi:putative oxidoreductase